MTERSDGQDPGINTQRPESNLRNYGILAGSTAMQAITSTFLFETILERNVGGSGFYFSVGFVLALWNGDKLVQIVETRKARKAFNLQNQNREQEDITDSKK